MHYRAVLIVPSVVLSVVAIPSTVVAADLPDRPEAVNPIPAQAGTPNETTNTTVSDSQATTTSPTPTAETGTSTSTVPPTSTSTGAPSTTATDTTVDTTTETLTSAEPEATTAKRPSTDTETTTTTRTTTDTETRTATTTTAEAVSGRVVDANDDPIEGATVQIPLLGDDLTTETDATGRFVLQFAGRETPETATLLVQKRGCLPSSRIIDTTTATTGLRIELASTGQRSVLVSEELHHLGDGNYEGQINSRFQESVEGRQLEAEFRLNRVQANAQKATLAFTTRGVQAGNEIRINGVDVGTTDLSDPDGSVSEQRITVDSSVLDSGVNSLSIVSVESGISGAPGDIDDFEVSNVRLLLGGVPQDGTKPTLTIDAPSIVEPGIETRLAAIADDNNRIRTVTMTLNHRGEVVTRETTTDRRLTFPATLDAPGTYTLLAQTVDQSGNVRERSVDIEVREAVSGGGATQTNEENLEHTLVIQATSTRRTFYEIRVEGDVNYEPEADTQTEADPGPVYPDKI